MIKSEVKKISAFLRQVGREGGGDAFYKAAQLVENNFLPWTCCRCKETFTEPRTASMVEGSLCRDCTFILAHYIEHPEDNPFPNSTLGLPTEPHDQTEEN